MKALWGGSKIVKGNWDLTRLLFSKVCPRKLSHTGKNSEGVRTLYRLFQGGANDILSKDGSMSKGLVGGQALTTEAH